MQIGDEIYYVNSGNTIDTYIITNITNDTIHVEYPMDEFAPLTASFNLTQFNKGELPRLFTDYKLAEQLVNKLSTEYEAKRQKEFDRILNDALNSVTLSTVEQYGTILKSKRSDYENYYSDAPGGEWFEANLCLYEGIHYIIVYKFIETKDNDITKECIRFSEKK